MDKYVIAKLLNRPPDAHKYDFGHVLVIGGSPGMVGAPFLAARAALRIGAGLVTIASSPEVTDKLEKRVEEIMTLLIESPEQVNDFIKQRKVNSLVIGPGLTEVAADLVLDLLSRLELPIVIDGGGLNILSKNLPALQKKLNKSSIPWVLTPHLGEFQRFFKDNLPKEPTSLKSVAQKFASQHKLVLVLKGHPTYVTNGIEIYTNKTGGPGLATAGTGDVLSGMIAGLIAQGVDPYEAAKAAVYLHGLAGDLASKEKTEPGMIASDIIEFIPNALKN